MYYPSAASVRSILAGLGTLLAGPAGAAVGALEEIVVTAQRQEVAVLATPLSIERIGGDTIALLGATHSSEVLNRIPGVMVQRGSG